MRKTDTHSKDRSTGDKQGEHASGILRVSRQPRRFLTCYAGRRVILVSLVLAIILLVLDNTFAISDKIISVVFPTTQNVAATNLFYFQTLADWGTVWVDGHELSDLPTVQIDPPIQLARGVHQIVWHTAPFRTMACQLVVPATKSTSQSCPTSLELSPNTFNQAALLVSPPTSFSLKLLPVAQQQVLIRAVQQQLDSLQAADTIQSGERYLLKQAVVEATQTLRASQRFLLDTDTSAPGQCQGITLGSVKDAACFISGRDCRLFCTLQWPADGPLANQPRWDIAAIVHPTWTYTPLATQQKPQGTQETSEQEQFVTLRISWQHGVWLVASHRQGDSSFDDPNCTTTISTIDQGSDYQISAQSHWAYISGSSRAQGCVAVTQTDAATQKADFVAEVLLRRFGVLLAVNATAIKQWPQLPEASPAEQRLAQQIIKHPAFTS